MDGHRPIIASRHGVVAAAHPLAAAAGARLLGKGGNAFDAAVAAAAAFGVVAPFAAGLGGVGVGLCFVAADRRLRSLDYMGRTPENLPAPPPVRSPKCAVAPACLAGWYNLLSAHGTRTLADVLAPAIALARDGFPLTAGLAAGFTATRAAQPGLAAWLGGLDAAPDSFRPGAVLRQPALAATLEAIAAHGPRHFYSGTLGERLTAGIEASGGNLPREALLSVDPDWGRPVAVESRGSAVHVPCPPAQALDVLLGLALLEESDLGGSDDDTAALLREAARLAAAARAGAGTDPAQAMLAEETIDSLRTRIAGSAGSADSPSPWPAPLFPAANTLAVADASGNVVCLTESLGSLGGSGIAAAECGICLNDVLAYCAAPLMADSPLGLPLLPLIATRHRHPVLALAGGADIPRLLAALTRRLHRSQPLDAALEVAGADGSCLGGVQAVALEAATNVATGAADPAGEGWAAPG